MHNIRRGRPRSVDRVAVHELRDAGLSAGAIAGRLGIGTSTVREILKGTTGLSERRKPAYTADAREARARSFWSVPPDWA